MHSDPGHASSRLREWRTAAGLTLAEVSDLTGLAAPVLSRVERGLTNLRPRTKVRVARALGVPIRDIFDPEILMSEQDEVTPHDAA